MTKLPLARLALLSIALCSSVQVTRGQPPQDDLFVPASPPSGEDPFDDQPGQEAGGVPRNKKEFTLDGVLLTANQIRTFLVNATTLQVQPIQSGGYGGMGEGMSGEGGDMAGGMEGAGMEGGMGMGGAMGGMGGMEAGMGMGGGMGGMGGGMGSMMGGMGGMSDMRTVVAFIMDDEQIAGRTRIEVLAPRGASGNYVRLENLPGAKLKTKSAKKPAPLWSPAAAKLIKDTICLKIWKEDAIKTLKAEEGKGEQAAASEKLLREVLSEEYDGQLARQQFELARLQERLKRIQEEFTRRQQAKDRVIEVQLGKIILEAQGILGEGQ